jgi:hypothetical protein
VASKEIGSEKKIEKVVSKDKLGKNRVFIYDKVSLIEISH